MKSIYVVLLILSTAVSVAESKTGLPKLEKGRAASGVVDSVALENEYVTVLKNASAGSKVDTTKYGTRVVVALTSVNIQSSRGVLDLKRGETAVFLVRESYKPPTGEYFEVAFKKKYPPLEAPEQWLEPKKNTFVYEDEQFRIFEERLAPGDERELHSHAQRVVIRLNPARLTDPRNNPDRTTKGSLQVPNTVKFAEPIVHVVRNVSQVPLFNIIIELKIPK